MHGSDHDWRNRFGPWALVTGSSDGIGRAMATELARRGLHLVLVARRRDVLDRLAHDLAHAHKIQIRVLALDLGDPTSVSVIAEETQSTDVGLVAACAGYGTSGRFLATDLQTELDMLGVNCRAVLHLAKTFGERMAARHGGGIVLMSSIVAFQGTAFAANYAATKAYVHTLAEGMAADLKDDGVAVTASAPGPVASGFAARAGMRMGATVSPETVARETLAALGKATVVRPGALSKLLGWNLAMLPRSARALIMGRIMKGMTVAKNVDEARTEA